MFLLVMYDYIYNKLFGNPDIQSLAIYQISKIGVYADNYGAAVATGSVFGIL